MRCAKCDEATDGRGSDRAKETDAEEKRTLAGKTDWTGAQRSHGGRQARERLEALFSKSTTGPEKMVCITYLRRTQAELSRTVKEQQGQTSPIHVRTIFSASVLVYRTKP